MCYNFYLSIHETIHDIMKTIQFKLRNKLSFKKLKMIGTSILNHIRYNIQKYSHILQFLIVFFGILSALIICGKFLMEDDSKENIIELKIFNNDRLGKIIKTKFDSDFIITLMHGNYFFTVSAIGYDEWKFTENLINSTKELGNIMLKISSKPVILHIIDKEKNHIKILNLLL